MQFSRALVAWGLIGAGLLLVGCGDSDEDAETVQCCMLKQLAERCDSTIATPSLMESVDEWRRVGNSGNAEACKALVDSKDNGCTGTTLSYDESDAIVDCS